MNTWLLLDCNYLCHRAFYTFSFLEFDGDGTGVLYGFFRDLFNLQSLHNTRRVAFCFDKGKNKRLELCPSYKMNRKQKEYTEEEVLAYRMFTKQVNALSRRYLKRIGYRNVFSQEGLEADDMIGSCVQNLPKRHRAIIVSSDKDFYQLLSKRVMMWNPNTKKPYTGKMFRAEYGIKPRDWVKVKAIAGCSSDNVPGIQGVGETTAVKYLRGELKETGKVFQRIEENSNTVEENLRVVDLPMKGTEPCRLKKDKIDKREWKKLAKELGMGTLVNEAM